MDLILLVFVLRKDKNALEDHENSQSAQEDRTHIARGDVELSSKVHGVDKYWWQTTLNIDYIIKHL